MKNIYCPESITKMLRPYELKAFEEKNNVLNVEDYGITPMDKFVGTTTDISLKNHHTRVFTVYVLDAILKGNIAIITKWEPYSSAGIYLGHSQFKACIVLTL